MFSFPFGDVRGDCVLAIVKLSVHRVMAAVVPVAALMAILVVAACSSTAALLLASVCSDCANTGSRGVGDPDGINNFGGFAVPPSSVFNVLH